MLLEDETDVLLFPPLRSAWAKVGQPTAVLLSGRNARRVLFGAIELTTGRRYLLSRMRQRAQDFIAFLRWLRQKLPDRSLVLVLDEDPSHTAHTSGREAQRLGIELLFLPKRSPELNPMESLWRMGKNTVCANRQYQDLLDEVLALLRYLSSLSDEQALQMTGILSPSFWLRFARSKFLCGTT